MKLKRSQRKAPPVQTGHDDRPEERSASKRKKEGQPSAPDGISGSWQ